MGKCITCGKEGGFLEVRKRELPSGTKEILCKPCYKEKNKQEMELYKKQQARQNEIYELIELILRRMNKDEIVGLCNEKEVPLVLDHIDGNPYNNCLSNLRLVCCNCDAQLPTYKGKNRGNGRYNRKLRYRNNLSY